MCCLFPIPEPYSCFIPALALSPSNGWTNLLSIPVSFLFLPHHLHNRIDDLSFHSCSCSVAFKRLDNPSFHPCPIPVLPMSPSKRWTPFISIPVPFPFLPIPVPFLLSLCHLQKAGQPLFPFLLHSCSHSVASKRLDNPSFHSCPIPALVLLSLCRLQKAGQPLFPFLLHSCSRSVASKRLDNPSFHSCPIPALALSPSQGWPPHLSIPAPFLPHSCSCTVASKRLDNPSFHSYPIPVLALSPSKMLDKLLFPFLLYPSSFSFTFQKPGHPFFPFLSLSYSSPSHHTFSF